jgi:hypothetical protein
MDRELLQLEFLHHDLVQLGRSAFLVIGLGIRNFEFMQLPAAARDGRADGSLGIGRLGLLRDKGAHKFSFFADHMKFHSYRHPSFL